MLHKAPGLVIITVALVLELFVTVSGARPATSAPTFAVVVGLAWVRVVETLSITTVEVTEPTEFMTLTRYLLLFITAVTLLSVRLAAVPPGTSVHVLPPLVDTCHWNVGAGVPVAVTLNVALCPAFTV